MPPVAADKLAARAAYNAYEQADHLLREVIAGFGHTTDRPLPAKALLDLANDGDIEAQLAVAYHFAHGTGGWKRDPAAAAEWYRRAAAAGAAGKPGAK